MSTSRKPGYMFHLHLSNVDFGELPRVDKGKYILYGGTAKKPCLRSIAFSGSNKDKKSDIMTFSVGDPQSATIKLTLYRVKLLGDSTYVGELNLCLSSFELNTVVSHSFPLKTKLEEKISICIDAHLANNGAEPFYAFPGRIYDEYVLGEVVEYDYIN